MKKLDINRDKVQPSDEDLLRHQNFDDVLKKANLKSGANTGLKTAKRWWFFVGSGLLVLGVVVAVINVNTNTTKGVKNLYSSDNQLDYVVQKMEIQDLAVLNNISETEIGNNIEALPLSKDLKTIPPVAKVIGSDSEVSKPIKYYYPKEASTLTFSLEKSFKLRDQYKQMPEFSIYENLSFQPIGEYQKGWLKANWSEVELIKKGTSYFLLLKKNGTTFVCEVVPVFESEDFVKALDVYASALVK